MRQRSRMGRAPSVVRSLLEFFRPEPQRTLPPLIRPMSGPLDTLRQQSQDAVRSAPILEALQDMMRDRVMGASSNGSIPLVTREIEVVSKQRRQFREQ